MMISDSIKINKSIGYKGKVALLMGIVSTMPIVGMSLSGRFISFFKILFATYFILTFISVIKKGKRIFNLSQIKMVYMIFLLWPLISYLVGLMYMPGHWHSSMTSYVVKVFEYLILTVLMYIEKNKEDALSFAKGLIIGIIANAIWSILQAVTYYILDQSLNTIIFVNILGLKSGGQIWNGYGGIRVSGFNYDPAHLGGILPILFFYSLMKKDRYILIISLLSLAFSQSTTAVVGCILVIMVYLFEHRKFKLFSVRRRPWKMTLGLFAGMFIVISIILLTINSNIFVTTFISGTFENITGFFNRINNVYIKASNIGARGIYYGKAFDRMVDRGVLLTIIGTGLGTSMYPFRIYNLFSSGAQNTVTEVETNYIAYLFDLGIVGLFFYITYLILGCRIFFKIAKIKMNSEVIIYLGLFISVICISAFYHYIFTAYQMLAFSFATVYIDSILYEDKLEVL